MTKMYEPGNLVILQGVFRQRDKTPLIPTDPECNVKHPDGITYTAVTLDATLDPGVYEGSFLITLEGTHWYEIQCTLPIPVRIERSFVVGPERVIAT